jgi:hypothetical protein
MASKKKMTEPTPTPRMDWNGSLADFKNVTVNSKPAGSAITNKGATYTPPANASKAYTGPNLAAINKKFESSKLEKVGNVIGEASGVKDLQRVVNNPTKENIAWAGLSAAAYVVPGLVSAKGGRAVTRAGEAAAIEVMANRAGAEAAAQAGVDVTKSMLLKNRQGALISGGNQVAQLFGQKVTTTGPKSVPAVYAATQRMMNQAADVAQAIKAAEIAGKVSALKNVRAAVMATNVVTAKGKNKANTVKK